MDILYTIKNSDVCEELTYSLRSLKNLPHDKVFIVGGCPKNINKEKIIHIPTQQLNSKYRNTTNNWRIACLDNRLSENFILMNDDFFIMSPIVDVEKELNLNFGTVDSVIRKYYATHKIASFWLRGMVHTKEYMQNLGIKEPLSYELHIPFIVNKTQYLRMLELPGVSGISVLHKRTLLGNLFKNNTVYSNDVKVFQNNNFVPERYPKFLSCSDKGWQVIKPYLQEKFPTPSEYEIVDKTVN